MDYPITDQPGSGFGMPMPKQGGNLEGLERLAQLRELKIKQRHPGCLECKFIFFQSGVRVVEKLNDFYCWYSHLSNCSTCLFASLNITHLKY